MDQTVYIGVDSALGLKRLFQIKNGGKVFLVTGKKSFDTSGAKEYVLNNIPEKAKVLRFSEFESNPNIRDLRNGLKIANEFRPSIIIAIGGGSVIDMGKLIRFFYTRKGDIMGRMYTSDTNLQIPLVAIPTTAGTGSEATHFAVLYDEQKKKHSIANNAILPDYAIIDSVLTYNQSPYLTACSGFDALAQAIEAYWNKNATTESDGYARRAIDLIYDTLPQVVARPTPGLRDKMAEGAHWAGKAINITKTTAPHAFSYPFTAHYGIPHGHAVGIVFPDIAEYNINNACIPEEKREFLTNIIKSSRYFRSYLAQIGLTVPAKDYNINTILNGVSIERLVNNPAKIDISEAKEILFSVIS